MIKRIMIASNLCLVAGLICLFIMQFMLAISMFAISLTMSLVLFNVLLRDRKGLKWAINGSFLFVVLVIVVAYFIMTK
ncbi:MAG: hypothetical protein E6663_14450 [Staphylococcus lugdunensis]|nr:hypothetical protein [Staphylococcus lugdunensis]